MHADDVKNRRRNLVAGALMCVGLTTILVTIGFHSSVLDVFHDAADGTGAHPDWSKLKGTLERASTACDAAGAKIGGARVQSKANDSIFVSIASYRDNECAPTVYDMFEKAKSPKSIFVGIVEQHDATQGDPSCMPKEWEAQCQHAGWCPSDNLRFRRIAPKDAKGPTYGRYIGALMYAGERFYMMIDSHNRFVTHWDHIAITMYLGINAPKPVLSHYPEAWHNPKVQGSPPNPPLDGRGTTTYLCKARVLPNLGYLRLDGFVVSKRKTCRPQPWAAAGFLFAYGRLLSEVPFDPHLDFVFDGEEILYSARMWTSGWDMFSPSEAILYHYYYRHGAPRFWSLLPADYNQRKAAAERRIQYLLELYKFNTTDFLIARDTTEVAVTVEKDKYGLGKARRIDEWYSWIGMDRTHWRTDEERFCKKYS
jgi:hypothetical protein